MKSRKPRKNQQEEYGMEFGDVNAIKNYELQADKNEDKQKQKKKNDKC